MAVTMIALVGGQTLPNFFPVKVYRPDQLLLVYSDRTEKQYHNLKSTLEMETKVLGL
ncbi:hypothetical protein EI42_03307 [Thermosporothrix hazakensis]|jgi:hypothetical protein|uniref:Uncharacterized protein n=2 Tax=Thermosporothrix TaxID=768650 RepID=A0A326UI24_THEHA|nr:hypothetical protein [Thermosporothrix hazakensis]PZW27929.1 hypothetical protein EI42_03307 [Thermosporothrix hazakensis]BBH86857.1 hypothetical protein KTC_16080 [Thermosporothrix sp. COM3]GCE51153.1 hypothetical protein KTH_60220 [Thermosporothrix hazakensis]